MKYFARYCVIDIIPDLIPKDQLFDDFDENKDGGVSRDELKGFLLHIDKKFFDHYKPEIDEDDDDVTPIPAPPTSSTLSDGLMLPSKSLSLFVLLPTNIIDDVAVVVVDDDDDDNDASSAARDFAAA